MKFHFGHHYHSGGGGRAGDDDRGRGNKSSSNNTMEDILIPTHPSSLLFMDVHSSSDNTTTTTTEMMMGSSVPFLTAETTEANNLTVMEEEEEHRQELGDAASSSIRPHGETLENNVHDHHGRTIKSSSRQFFRIKGRRSRSSSPVTDDDSRLSLSSQRQDLSEQATGHQQQQHRLNVMDLLRPARLRRSTSLPTTTTASTTTTTTTASTSSTSSNHSSTTSSTSKQHKRNVTFTSIQIREYNTILGDHPCCQSGPPLALGWEYNEQDEVVIDIDEYERAFVNNDNHGTNDDDNTTENNNGETLQVRRRSMNELRLNCEDRREILCGLRKPVEDHVVSGSVLEQPSASLSTNRMEQDDDDGSLDENQPLHDHRDDGSGGQIIESHATCSTTSPSSTTGAPSTTATIPLYTKEELRKAERKLERERRHHNSGNAARTRRRLKRGFFMPLTPEEEESYNRLNNCSGGDGGLSEHGNEEEEHLEDGGSCSSSSEDDDDGVISMDISPMKDISPPMKEEVSQPNNS